MNSPRIELIERIDAHACMYVLLRGMYVLLRVCKFKFKFLLDDPVTDEQNYVTVQIEKFSQTSCKEINSKVNKQVIYIL